MKIIITGASVKTYWYEDAIGKVYTVEKTVESERKYQVDGGWYVNFEDAEEVIEHNSQLYRKVDRPVREGDTVLITELDDEEMNRIFNVERLSMFPEDFRINEFINGDNYVEACVDKFTVIEPIEQPVQPSAPSSCAFSYAEVSELLHQASDMAESIREWNAVIQYNGKQYRKVKREASVGELVVVTDFKPEKHIPDFEDTKNGDVFTAVYIWDDGDVDTGEDDGVILTPEEYSVLELVEQSGQDELLTVNDLLANLAQEVASLKKDLHRITGAVIDAQSDIVDLEDRLDENEKDTEEVIARMNDLGDGAEDAAVVPVEVIEKVIAELKTRKATAYKLCDTYERRRQLELAQFADGKAHANMEAIELLEEALRNG